MGKKSELGAIYYLASVKPKRFKIEHKGFMFSLLELSKDYQGLPDWRSIHEIQLMAKRKRLRLPASLVSL